MSRDTPLTPHSYAVQPKPRTVHAAFVSVKQSLTPYEFEQVCRIFVRIALRIQEREKHAIQEKDINIPTNEEPV